MNVNYLILVFSLLLFNSIVTAQKLKSTTRTQIYPYGQVSAKLIREFDKNENLIKQVIKDFRGISTRTSFYTIDNKGRMTSDSTFDSDNKLIEANYYTYNDHDDIVLQKRFYLNENVYYEERYDRTYNSNGFATLVNEYNKEGELGWTYKYKYDSQGNERQRLSIFKGTKREVFKKKYKNGHLIIDKLYVYDSEKDKKGLHSYWVYEYDKDGLNIKQTVYTVAKQLTPKIEIHELKYDENGNLIEDKTITDDGKLKFRVEIKNTYWQ